MPRRGNVLPAVPVPRREKAKRPVPTVRRTLATDPPREKSIGLPPSGQARRRPTAAALEQIGVDALARGWGWRHVALGASGSGKTYWLNRLMGHVAASVDLVLIHDAKDPIPQYGGTVRPRVSDLATSPPNDTNIVVIHAREPIQTPDDVAAAALVLARAGSFRVVVLIDEIYDAMSGRQSFAAGTMGPISEIMRKGRSIGVSLACSSQIPQSLPTEILDLADTLVLFRLDARSLAYVDRTENLDPEAAAVVPRLAQGECILLRRGHDWDRTIYGPA